MRVLAGAICTGPHSLTSALKPSYSEMAFRLLPARNLLTEYWPQECGMFELMNCRLHLGQVQSGRDVREVPRVIVSYDVIVKLQPLSGRSLVYLLQNVTFCLIPNILKSCMASVHFSETLSRSSAKPFFISAIARSISPVRAWRTAG